MIVVAVAVVVLVVGVGMFLFLTSSIHRFDAAKGGPLNLPRSRGSRRKIVTGPSELLHGTKSCSQMIHFKLLQKDTLGDET